MPANSNQFQLTASDLGLKSFDMPPNGFDPKAAPDDVLKRFGVLQRPGPDTSIQYRKFWDGLFSRDATYVAPRFKSRTSRPSLRAVSSFGAGGVRYDNWAGIGVESNGAPIISVSGTWNVPNLDVPPGLQDGTSCINSVWIGIDGFSAPSKDILQAGIDLRVTRQAGVLNVEILPWWEWWQGDSFYFDGFPVSPGDIVSCNISGTAGGTAGTLYMANLVSGRHISLSIPAPAGTTLIGNCAEWIVERQTFDANSSILTELSLFGSIFLDNAFATTAIPPKTDQQTISAGHGTLISMTATDNVKILASPTILGPTTFRVDRSG
jgi:Peptidase A4 family